MFLLLDVASPIPEFHLINDKKTINHLYMIQNVMNWPHIEVFSCQVWYLGETGVNQIKQHWS